MTDALPPFLAIFELDPAADVDERALRRAYARRLKQIDVEAEPERFQALREALDQGLRWLAWRERMARTQAPAPEPEPLAAPKGEASLTPLATPPEAAPGGLATGPDADALAAAVVARLRSRIDAGLAGEDAARRLLLEFLGDPDLVSLDARAAFELGLARLLAGNWQPGHEHLLDPAIEVFGWNSDHARLKHFGQVGMLLTAAIRERDSVHAFGPAQRIALDALLARIRRDEPPDPARLPDEVAQLRALVDRIPNWMRIVSPVGPVNARFEMWRRRPPAPPPVAGPTPRFMARKPASALTPGGLVLGALILLLTIGREFSGTGHPIPAGDGGARDRMATAADEADLARRQKEAEALLARIRQTGDAGH